MKANDIPKNPKRDFQSIMNALRNESPRANESEAGTDYYENKVRVSEKMML